MQRVDVASEVLTALAAVLSHHVPGRPVYLFGSRVTGLAQPTSDLDLAIGGEPALDWRQMSALRCAIDDIDLPFDIDVLDLHDTTCIFRRRIEAEWVPFAEAQSDYLVQVSA